MVKVDFQSKNGTIKATVTCEGSDINSETFEKCVGSLLQHLSAHVNTYNLPEVFEEISRRRRVFMDDILKYLVEIAQETGGKVPKEVREHLTHARRKEWDPEKE